MASAGSKPERAKVLDALINDIYLSKSDDQQEALLGRMASSIKTEFPGFEVWDKTKNFLALKCPGVGSLPDQKWHEKPKVSGKAISRSHCEGTECPLPGNLKMKEKKYGNRQEGMEKFARFAFIHGSLADHPCIEEVQTISLDLSGKETVVYHVTPSYERVARKDITLEFARKATQTLLDIHARGIAHRGVIERCVMIDEKGSPRITDFDDLSALEKELFPLVKMTDFWLLGSFFYEKLARNDLDLFLAVSSRTAHFLQKPLVERSLSEEKLKPLLLTNDVLKDFTGEILSVSSSEEVSNALSLLAEKTPKPGTRARLPVKDKKSRDRSPVKDKKTRDRSRSRSRD